MFSIKYNKNKIVVLALIMPLFIFGQWTQIGNNINGISPNDQSGYSVSLNADGNIIVIGEHTNSDNGSASGKVRIFENQSDNWVEIGSINGSEAGDRFGFSVSINANGNIIAVGSPDNNGNGFESGQVRIFENQAGTWQQIAEIVGDSFSDHLGYSISLSDNGNHLAIGAPDAEDNDSGSNFGHVKIYENQSGTWQQIGDNIIGEEAEDKFGYSVSINENGNIVAIGTPLNDEAGSGAGHVRVYTFQSDNWEQIGEDLDGETINDKFGESVSINNTGNIIAIGATDYKSIGYVKIFENQSNNWIQIGNNIIGEEVGDDFGIAVNLNALGDIVAIGGYFNNNSGHARIYKNQSGTWEQIESDIDGEEPQDRFGKSISLSADGSIVAIGAYLNDSNGTNSGHTRIFTNSNLANLQDNNFINNFYLYPNPCNNYTTINLNKTHNNIKIEIYNTLGKQISSKAYTNTNIININTSQYSKGVYIIKLISKNTNTLKFIKN